jgi:hypothetical protein
MDVCQARDRRDEILTARLSGLPPEELTVPRVLFQNHLILGHETAPLSAPEMRRLQRCP